MNKAPKCWIPRCPVPERLWDVYQGQGEESMPKSTLAAARSDLLMFQPPPGLGHERFIAHIAGIMRQMPLIEEVGQRARNELNDDAAHELLAERLPDSQNSDVQHAWKMLKHWLPHFFPNDYRVKTDRERLVQGRRLPGLS